MKKTSYLKVRTTPELQEKLRERADKAGMRISTFAYDILEREEESTKQSEELAALKSQMQELVAMVHTMYKRSPVPEAESQLVLRELRLIVRELAMHSNAQILARVATQLKP